MDRTVMEDNPHQVLEGMMIAAYAVGAQHGYFYIRGEYPIAIDRINQAIRAARRAGILGRSVLGSSFAFNADVRIGAGAFVCGEETALIRSIEGKRGMPRMRGIDKYTGAATKGMSPIAHMGYLLRTAPDWDYVKWLRDAWDGPFIIKGVMRPEDAEKLDKMGADAIWVSNHAGRQFDAALASIEVLPAIRAATKRPIIFDSGVETGLDILRAIALGADFVMLGRGFHFALGALGAKGVDHLIDILAKDLSANMGQLGAADLKSLPRPLDLP